MQITINQTSSIDAATTTILSSTPDAEYVLAIMQSHNIPVNYAITTSESITTCTASKSLPILHHSSAAQSHGSTVESMSEHLASETRRMSESSQGSNNASSTPRFSIRAIRAFLRRKSFAKDSISNMN